MAEPTTIVECNDHTEHICDSGSGYFGLLHHSPLDKPFPTGETEHPVGCCDTCRPLRDELESGRNGGGSDE